MEKDIRYFECKKCGAIIKIDEAKYKYPIRPTICYTEQGGCGQRSVFSELKEEWVKVHYPNIYEE